MKNNFPIVSIIVNNFNKGRYLKECLQSIMDQTYTNFEVIFWDDLSLDNSIAIAEQFEVDYPNIWLYFTEAELDYPLNVPLGVTRWLAVQKCKGKYIAFLDSDDYWFPYKLKDQVEILEHSKDCKLVFGNCRYVKDRQVQNRTFFDRYPPPEKGGEPFTFLLTKYNYIPMSTVMVERKALLDVMGESTHYTSGEDYDWWLKVTNKYPICYSEDLVSAYRVVGNSVTHGSKQRIRAQWYEIDAFREALNYRKLTNYQKVKAYLHLVRLYCELIYKEIVEKI